MSLDTPSMLPTPTNTLKKNKANAKAVETLVNAAAADTDAVSAFSVFDPNGLRFVGTAFVVRDHELAGKLLRMLESDGHITPGKPVNNG